MTTLEFVLNKFGLIYNDSAIIPIIIPVLGRNSLAKLFTELGFKIGVEIGVFEGDYSEILCKANPRLKLFCVDPWTPHKGYADYARKSTLDNAFNVAVKKLSSFNVEVVKKYSHEAREDFLDGSLDFVYIDGDHSFQTCTDDINGWSKKVKAGGIIAGHDYGKSKNPNIKVHEAVNEYTKSQAIKPWFILTAEHPKSWMWVKL